MQRDVYVITLTDNYSVEGQWVILDEEEAFEAWEEMLREYFQDEMELSIEEGLIPDNTNIEDYQHSDAWWDNDTRVKITLLKIKIGVPR